MEDEKNTIDSKKNSSVFIIILVSVIVLSLICTGVYMNNKQRIITGNTINNLEEQILKQNNILEEQEKLTEEQKIEAEVVKKELESQIEELAKVTCKDIEVPYDAKEEYTEQEPYSKTEEYYESEPYVEEECEMVALTYSKTGDGWDYSSCIDYDSVCYEGHNNFWGTWICDDEETFCTEKRLSYSVDINNLDDVGGSWIVKVKFYIDNELYETKEITQYLYPQTTKTFTGKLTVYSDSPSGDANQGFGASASVFSVPEKEVCETVTNYHDVLKTRQVTDYKTVTKTRTITKYRTETICE